MLLQQLQKELQCSCGKMILLTFREVGQIASCSCGQAYRMEINVLPSGTLEGDAPDSLEYIEYICPKCGERREVNQVTLADSDMDVICRCGEEMEEMK